MKYRVFGKTGWLVSEIGFGAWGIGGGWGPVDDQESIRTLLSAYEKGINFVDTAEMYGKGHSEEIIGRSLKEWKGSHVYVATKVQPLCWPHPREDNPTIQDRYPHKYVREQCEASLRRLGIETIDLYQLHGWFPRGIEETEWYDTLRQLQQEGKIREIGVSIRDYRPQDGIDLAKSGMIASEQVVYNLFEQRPAECLFPVCRENGVAIIARVPFDEGALTGVWTKDTYDSFAADDFRREYFKGDRFIRTLERVEMIKDVIAKLIGSTYSGLAEVALRFCLSDSAVNCVIPGILNQDQLEKNIRISDGIPLSSQLLDQLQVFRWPRNFHNPEERADVG